MKIKNILVVLRGNPFSDHLILRLAENLSKYTGLRLQILKSEKLNNKSILNNFKFEKVFEPFRYKFFFFLKNFFTIAESFIIFLFFWIKLLKKDFYWLRKKMVVKNLLIGDLFIDSYNRNSLRFLEKKIDLYTLNHLFKAICKTIYIEKLFKKNEINAVVGHNSGYANNGSITTKIAAKKNIPVLEPKYFDYIYWDNFKIRNGFAPVKFDNVFLKKIKTYKNKKQIKKISKFIYKRLYKKIKTNYTWSRDLKYSARYKNKNSLSTYNSKIKVLIAPHAFSDASHVEGTDFLFTDYYEHFKETLEFIKKIKIKNVLWIVRPHPSGHLYGEKGTVESLVKSINYKNIILCPKNTSTVDILNQCNVVITGRGTIALEAACCGIYTINAGPSIYSGFNFSLDPKTKYEYFKSIKNIKTYKKLNKNKINLAKSILYYLEKDSPIWNEITLFNKSYDKSEGKFKKKYSFMDKVSKKLEEKLFSRFKEDKLIN